MITRLGTGHGFDAAFEAERRRHPADEAPLRKRRDGARGFHAKLNELVDHANRVDARLDALAAEVAARPFP